MKKNKHSNIRLFFIRLLLGVVLLAVVGIYAADSDMKESYNRLYSTVDYVKEQCNRFTRIEMAAETKSLMRIVESDKQVSYQIEENNGTCSTDDLKKYAKNSYVSGIVILDRNGKTVSEYHEEGEAPQVLFETISSVAVQDIFEYPNKRYSVRINMPDGSEMDIAAMKMAEKDMMVAVYYHTPADYIESFNLSEVSLLGGYSSENDGIIVISESGTIIASNEKSLVGQSTEDIPILSEITQAKTAGKLVHAKQTDNSFSQYFGLMERGRDFYVYNYIPGQSVFKNTPKMIFYTLIGYIVLLTIIFGIKKRSEQQIQVKYTKELQSKNEQLGEAIKSANRANEAKTNFLSRMSHDIRTPLNGIIGLLEISEAHSDDKQLIEENREKMRIAAKHLLSLINDVLQMSKLESGEIVISHEPLDLNRLSSDILTIVEQKAAEEGVTLIFDENSDKTEKTRVYGSELHLRQIFLNIYTNSIKYNKVGGTITTRVNIVETDDNYITCQWIITDTGIGMSKEFVERIFEPFTQEKSDARSIYQGTGLGMTIVKELAERMNGTVEVHSEEGKGSEFVLTLPFELAPEQEETPYPMHDMTDRLDGISILMAEDNELNSEIARIILEDEGAKVTAVSNGKQAVDTFANSEPGTFDVILMDIMMPVMDGLTASQNIRGTDREDAKDIPIIAMTANAFKEDADRCFAAGMNAHIAKPLDTDKLKQTICEQTYIEKTSH